MSLPAAPAWLARYRTEQAQLESRFDHILSGHADAQPRAPLWQGGAGSGPPSFSASRFSASFWLQMSASRASRECTSGAQRTEGALQSSLGPRTVDAAPLERRKGRSRTREWTL